MPRPLLLLAPLLLACAQASPAGSPAPERQVIAITTEAGTIEFERYVDRRGSSHRIPALPASVWSALVKSYQELGIPLATLDQPAGRVGNPKLTARRTLASQRLSRLFHCGERGVGAPIADSYRLEIAILSELKPGDAEESVLETRLSALAYSPGTTAAPLQCSSTGALEERLLNATLLNLLRD